MPGLRLSSSLAVLTTLLQLRKLPILHRRSKPNFKPPEISRISFVTFLVLAYDLRHSRRFIKNDSNENQDSLNPQGVIDYAQWMIDRRGNPPRIDHLPLRHQVLASRVTITTMRFVAALKIANLVKHNSSEHQIFGCSLPATEAEAAKQSPRKGASKAGLGRRWRWADCRRVRLAHGAGAGAFGFHWRRRLRLSVSSIRSPAGARICHCRGPLGHEVRLGIELMSQIACVSTARIPATSRQDHS